MKNLVSSIESCIYSQQLVSARELKKEWMPKVSPFFLILNSFPVCSMHHASHRRLLSASKVNKLIYNAVTHVNLHGLKTRQNKAGHTQSEWSSFTGEHSSKIVRYGAVSTHCPSSFSTLGLSTSLQTCGYLHNFHRAHHTVQKTRTTTLWPFSRTTRVGQYQKHSNILTHNTSTVPLCRHPR